MGARWQKNEVAATKRRCDLLVQKSDGTLAPRGTDFIALGYVFVSGVNSPDYDLAVGTLTNKRRPFTTLADFTFTAAVTDVCTKVAHTTETGDGPVRLTTTTTLPAPLALATDYWIIKIDADTFYLATTLANAYAGTRVDITTTGTGTHTVDITTSTKRGIDGHFTYQATQAETNHSAPETSVIIDGTLYERSIGWGAYTTVEMSTEAADIGSTILEGSTTRDDAQRIILRTLAAKFSVTAGVLQFRDLADTKNSHHGTITASGRVAAVIDDAT